MKIKNICLIIIMLFMMLTTAAGQFKNTEKISLELESVSLPMVLNMIAQQYGLNLVLSGEVKGKVTVRLEQVDIQTALETILFPNGYNYYFNNDVIVVKPTKMDAVGELESRVVTLKYVEPITVKNILEALISKKGKIVILDKMSQTSSFSSGDEYNPNRILISDFPSNVTKMLSLIETMDIQEQVISIEVKIIESNIDSKSKLGLSWPTSITTKIGSNETSSDNNSSSSSSTSSINDYVGSLDFNNGNIAWGVLSVAQVSMVLNLLEEEGNSKLISNPHITTLENHQAVIKIETIIPIPTVSRFTEGASTQDILTFYDEEVGISLIVTPRINEDGKITLEVNPKVEDIVSFTGSEEAQKPITISRSIKTRITVADGETAALGGLLKEDIIEKKNKVPLLGSIPIIGKLLFTSKSEEKTTKDLIILITPHIMP